MKRDDRATRSRHHIAGSSADPTHTNMKAPPSSLAGTPRGRRFHSSFTDVDGRRPSRSLSLNVKRQPGLPVLYLGLLAALCLSMLLLLSGSLAWAQDNGPIEYAEDRTDPVATFTAEDPEEKDITWSLSGTDEGDFKITDGVLEFASPPDFEDPSGGADDASNTYTVTVVASAGASDTDTVRMVEREVTVEVTNVEEPGSIMLSTLQPQVGVQVTATLTDEDVVDGESVEWQWYRGATEIPGAIAANFTPSAGDVGFLLQVKASYDDAEGEDKSTEQSSDHPVRAAPASNIAPVFPDEAVGDDDVFIKPREVDENTASGENIGAPIAATDPGDVLTYAFGGATTPDGAARSPNNSGDEANFDIDRATGQLMTKSALDHEAAGGDTYTVTVTATDPFGVEASAQVTINIGDVNEAPTITRTPPLAAAISYAELDETTALPTYAATDVDQGADNSSPDTLTWSLTGADAGKFDIGNQTGGTPGQLTFKTAPNYESPGDADGDNDYQVTVVVSDGKGNSDEHNVTISVTNVEEQGTVTISTLQPRVGVELSADLTDPDGDINDLMWQWYDGAFAPADPETNAIEDATSAAYTPVADDIGDTLTAVATYKDGAETNTDVQNAAAAAAVIADRTPRAPVFPDQDTETEGDQTDQKKTVDENTATATNIDDGNPVAATDPNPGDTLTYTLGGTDAASFAIVAGTGQLQTKAALDHETKDSYSVTVTATDSLGLSTTINVTIEVNDVDEAPELEGDSSAMYLENGTGPVATYTATDPEEMDIVWSLTGSDADDFSIDGGMLEFNSPPDFENPADADTNNTYTVTVVASAGASDTAEVRTATFDVTVTVTDKEEPGSIMLSTLQPQVGQEVTATLTDGDTIDPSTVNWQWFRGSTPINGSATSGAVTATYTPIDGDAGSRLRAKATYDDSEGEDKSAQEDSAHSTRRAPSSNTAPVFPDQNPAEDGEQTDQDREIAENTPAGRSIGAPVRATDSGDVLTYSLGGPDEASFDIDRATGQLRTKNALDHETDTEHTVTVTATDPFGVSAEAEVTIEVTDVNEDPTITGTPAAAISFAELNETTLLPTYAATDVDDGEQATLEWSLEGDDAEDFEISETGVLTFESTPNYESPADADGDNDYKITVVVTDAEGNTDEHNVTISVTNVEEDGTVTLSTLQPRVGVELTAMLTDPDGAVTDLMWQWNDGTADIEDATSASYTPVADDIGDTLTATATYKDGAGTNVDTAPVNALRTVIADIRNKAPFFPDQDAETDGDQTDQERDVPENYATGGTYGGETNDAFNYPNIGALVTATDNQFATVTSATPDADTLTYTLGGTDAASFRIDRTSGQLEAKAALDYEAKKSYMVTVTATDPSGLSATVNVTINVTDVDEAPEIMLGGLAISGPSSLSVPEGTTEVDTYTAAGPNAASAMWTLSGDDAEDFDISSTGVLTFAETPNFEAPADADTDNVYTVTVDANDGTYSNSRDVTVTVTNVEEAGELTLSPAPSVGVEVTATLTDLDGMVSGQMWQWASENDDGTYSDIVGATLDKYTPVAEDDGKHLRVTVLYTDGHGSDKRKIKISDSVVTAGDPLVERYDDNNDRCIQLDEARDAVGDYFGPPRGISLSLEDARTVVGLHFECRNRQSQ